MQGPGLIMPNQKKVRVHVKKNHASPDTFPPTPDLVFRNMRRYLAGDVLANAVRPELGY